MLAHRGFVEPGSGIVENSFAAIAAAEAIGCRYVESDCHLTADGVVVLFHDDDLARVAGDPRAISDVTIAELEDVMAERGGVAVLRDVLAAFPAVSFNLDVKAADAARPIGRVIAPHADRVLITSFSEERRRTAVQAAVAAGDDRPATSAGMGRIAAVVAVAALGLRSATARLLRGIDAVQVPERFGVFRIVTARFVRRVHGAGCEVHVWTVNEPAAMRRLLALGVDGLVTDRPDLALPIARAAQEESGRAR